MDDSFRVRCGETVSSLQRVINRFSLRQGGAGHALAQGLTFQKFRDNVRRAFMRTDVKDDQDVGVIERAGGLRLLLETA